MIIFLIAIIVLIGLLPAIMFLKELDSDGLPVLVSDMGSDTLILLEAVAEGEGLQGFASDTRFIWVSPWL